MSDRRPPDQPGTIRLLVVDDDPLVRAGLVLLLDGAAGIEVVAQAGDGAEVPAAVARHAPDLVLMDLRMPRVDGVMATAALTARPGSPPVVALTTFDGDDDVTAALGAGAAGFLLKDTPPAQLVDALHRAAAGEAVLSPRIIGRLMTLAADVAGSRRRALLRLSVLTERELDVALAVAGGGSNSEIARHLHVSVATVKSHLSSAMSRLQLANRTQLALLAHDSGLA